MRKPDISSRFDVHNIRKIRDYNSPRHGQMTHEEIVRDLRSGTEEIIRRYGCCRHFKGNEYEVLHIARDSETEETMVVYRALYGDGGVWCRPASMWNEENTRDGQKFRRLQRIS